ncbi:MAG: hypothetical protein EOP53_20735 [Sphingobacteriales bacterium]|nr:MAG: hypothetical protein EOP53_20735 [Sphingobacteriales bacterium]
MQLKNYTLLLFFLLLLNNVFSAAKTDEPKTGITATVDGKGWIAGVTMCNVEISSFEISGFGDNQFGISLHLNGAPTEGTFEISKKSKHKASYSSMDAKYAIGANDVGKIIITKYDAAKKMFTGTFELYLTDAKTGKKVHITNGKFTEIAYFDKQPKNSFEFKAKLNGAKWNDVASVYGGSYDSAQLMAFDGKLALMFKFPQNIIAGEYDILNKSAFKADLVKRDFKDTFDIKKGKLIIVKNDINAKKVSGQFELEAQLPGEKGNVKFTDGSFSIFYKE